jgi:hypothetical protein
MKTLRNELHSTTLPIGGRIGRSDKVPHVIRRSVRFSMGVIDLIVPWNDPETVVDDTPEQLLTI